MGSASPVELEAEARRQGIIIGMIDGQRMATTRELKAEERSLADAALLGRGEVAATMAAGLMVRKYVGRVEDFLVAGREMKVYLGIASLAATEFGIITCMYTAQSGYNFGFAGAVPGIAQANSKPPSPAALARCRQTAFVAPPPASSRISSACDQTGSSKRAASSRRMVPPEGDGVRRARVH